MSESVKFPFKVSDKVIRAFRESETVDRVTRMLVRAIYEESLERKSTSPWEILSEEHPELKEYQAGEAGVSLTFDSITGAVRIAKKL